MFPRVLLKNTTWLMTIDWLGLGKLEVSNYQTGRSAVAPAWLKSHFINTFHVLSTKGVDIGPANPDVLQLMESYAGFVLDPEALLARAALSQSPEDLAESVLTQPSCRCFTPPFDYRDFETAKIGIDMPRYGEVSVETCKLCRAKWLHYFVEYEAFTASGRWFRGLITDQELQTIKAEDAVQFLQQLPWHFAGGSHFHSTGHLSTGVIRADLSRRT